MASALSHLCLFLLLLLPLPSISQQYTNISLGSSLTTQNENSSWVSPSGNFAFGFRRLTDSNSFLLAIWFDKITEKTLVWYAKPDDPVQGGSKVELTDDGRLVLTNNEGRQIWTTQQNGSVASAAMLDSGNLVLIGPDTVFKWQSFGQPTDTILPTQILGRDSKISAQLKESDYYSNGRFQLQLQSNGNLRLCTVAFPTESVDDTYWESGTAENGSQLVFNQSGRIYLTQTNGTLFNVTRVNLDFTRDFYKRGTLDPDGVFRLYVYPKTTQSNGRWPQSWSVSWFNPSNICTQITAEFGSGACGFNSYCILDENQRPDCRCPTGYSYLDSNNKYKGCKPDFVPQSCEQDGSIGEAEFYLEEMANADWPLSDFERYDPITEDSCRQACLDDCFCAVAIFRGSSCWKKKLPLSNGRMDSSLGGKALIKVSRRGNSSLQPPLPPNSGREKEDRSTLVLTGSVLLGSSAFINLLLLALSLAMFYSHHKKSQKRLTNSNPLWMNMLSFTYKELEEATDGFKEELGRGAFATVYKGIMAMDSTTVVAVKKLERLEQCYEEFETEVRAICRTHHKNLVQLLGFCNEGSQRLLVFEFMSNGSLENFLFRNLKPNWSERIEIVFGIARGLLYLHEECSGQIIHCDIKPQNILLDDRFTARISDFGISKLLKMNQTQTDTGIRGTKGYVAPEWFKRIPISAKVDVYSFGILLLEIICCRKNIELETSNELEMILSDWAYDCYREGRLDKLVKDDNEAMNDYRRLERFVMVAIWCIQEEPSLRPSMRKVTQMLEGAVEVSVPPDPASFISSIS